MTKYLSQNACFETVDERPYKVYTALLNQGGTNAPVATVLENTIGDIVWSRFDGGSYEGVLTGAFSVANTFTIPNYFGMVGWDGHKYKIEVVDDDHFALYSYSGNFSGLSDDMLINFPIEIRVYN